MKQEAQVILCPYCGHAQKVPTDQAVPDQCEECRGLFEPLSRRATQISMGPWYIRDKAMPFRPGCSFEVLKKQVAAGRIRPTTVLRGPTTKQFWSVARNVPGVAHLLGYCHSCGAKAKPGDAKCSSCGEKFEEVSDRNALGLQFRTQAEAAAAQKALEKEIASLTGAGPAESTKEKQTAGAGAKFGAGAAAGGATTATASGKPAAPGAGLLDQVLGGGSPLLNFDSQESDSGGTAWGANVQTISAGPSPEAKASPESKPATSSTKPAATSFAAQPQSPSASQAQPAGKSDNGLDEIERKNKMVNYLTWGLIGFNAVLIIVVVLLFVLNKDKPSDSEPAPSNTKDRVDDDRDSRRNERGGSDGGDKLVYTPQKMSASKAAQFAKPVAAKRDDGDVRRLGEVDGKLALAREHHRARRFDEARALLTEVRDDYPELRPDNIDELIRELDRQESHGRKLREIERLWADGRLKEAYTIMIDIRDNYPRDWLVDPDGFINAIDNIKEQMKSNNITFFGVGAG